jgi:hypothetical protein
VCVLAASAGATVVCRSRRRRLGHVFSRLATGTANDVDMELAPSSLSQAYEALTAHAHAQPVAGAGASVDSELALDLQGVPAARVPTLRANSTGGSVGDNLKTVVQQQAPSAAVVPSFSSNTSKIADAGSFYF